MQFLQTLWGPNGVILLGALISAIGALWASNSQTKVNDVLQEKSTIILTQSNELRLKSDVITQKNSEILDRTTELAAKSDEIANLNRELLNYSTGGNSYPIAQIIDLDNNTNSGLLAVHNSSNEYPLFNLRVRVYDWDSKEVRTKENMFGDDKIFDSDMIPASSSHVEGNAKLGSNSIKNFTIQSSARNGQFLQTLKLRKVEGIWRSVTKVTKIDGQELYKQVDKKYPLDEKGLVDWKSKL
ncbi:conserved hypothetical protein [Vibrio crassostreae]|uniref:hypothetical protein n=1 Tax=Vibrio crassostreae TaxID=246167 RepID=UPI000F482EDC|nr:hypothetical protein [Vibrio crassostreae]ROR05806.1 hypothetical protein EDB36_12218 [Vibrio crassostreae]CAK2012782.1 conserved hypothetical protein [Vibrio crassostreae]CAK2330281.1 conserved hypothetical protein [Vibrio crassostreae]CAK2347172.1 conserved hypothetical protein [Vibrio crassostreae]CAK3330493.1 conserved hypothetical protein [Vibrio crassostreae]